MIQPNTESTQQPKPSNQAIFTDQEKIDIELMYMSENLKPVAIAKVMGKFTPRQITQYVSKAGLAKKKKQAKSRVDSLVKSAIQNHADKIEEWQKQVSDRAQKLALTGLDSMESAEDGKEFSSYANGAEKMFKMVRTAEGLDSKQVNHFHTSIDRIHGRPKARLYSAKPSEDTEHQTLQEAEPLPEAGETTEI
ncbi:MAG: hypothetical protein V3V88_02960 [Dehalococcoidia bacterium]